MESLISLYHFWVSSQPSFPTRQYANGCSDPLSPSYLPNLEVCMNIRCLCIYYVIAWLYIYPQVCKPVMVDCGYPRFSVFEQVVWNQIRYPNGLLQHLEDHSEPRAVLVSPCQPHPPAGDVLHAGHADPHLAARAPCKDLETFPNLICSVPGISGRCGCPSRASTQHYFSSTVVFS